MPAAYGRSKCITELRLRGDVVQRIKDGRMPPCDFELPFQHPPRPTRVESDKEETDTSSLGSSATEDETAVAQDTIQMDDENNSKTGYTESV